MQKLLILCSIFIIVSTLSPEVSQEKESFAEFQKFINRFGKKYTSIQEYMSRFEVFKRNFKKTKKNSSHAQGITQFSDMTENEFRRNFLNLNINILNTFKYTPSTTNDLKVKDAPESFDWVKEGALGNVKNQGNCGSCWAFSTVGNLEGLYYIKHKENKIFSEQQLVDCDTEQDQGCNGGLMEFALEYIKNIGGLEENKNYPYKGYQGQCKADKTKFVLKVTDYVKLDYDDEAKIKEFLFQTGPLSIALNASPLQFYDGGILDLDASDCDPQGLNHGVVLVGYGTENGQDFWIVRNSWSASWGENGYFRIARGKGTCGVNTYITSATIE